MRLKDTSNHSGSRSQSRLARASILGAELKGLLPPAADSAFSSKHQTHGHCLDADDSWHRDAQNLLERWLCRKPELATNQTREENEQ